VSGISGRFNDNADNGPYRLELVSQSVTRSEVLSGTTTVAITPVGHDTWRFNYKIVMSFSDGNPVTRTYPGIALSESTKEVTFGLGWK